MCYNNMLVCLECWRSNLRWYYVGRNFTFDCINIMLSNLLHTINVPIKGQHIDLMFPPSLHHIMCSFFCWHFHFHPEPEHQANGSSCLLIFASCLFLVVLAICRRLSFYFSCCFNHTRDRIQVFFLLKRSKYG